GERRPPVEVRLEGGPRAELPVRPPRHRLGGLEPLGVDVVEGDRGVGELGEGEQVAEQVARELDAARADECDACHERKCFRSDRNDQECSQQPNVARSISSPRPAVGSRWWRPISAPSCAPPATARSSPPTTRRCSTSSSTSSARSPRTPRRCCSTPRSPCPARSTRAPSPPAPA